MTRPRLVVACALLGCAPLLAACNAIFGIDPFVVYDGGETGGAAGGASTSSSSASSSGGAVPDGGGSGGTGGSGGAKPPPGQAIELDGIDDFVAFPDTSAFTPPTGFTWELWFRGTGLPTGDTVERAQTLLGAMDGAACEDIYLGFGSETSPALELAFVVDGLGACGARDGDPVRFVPPGGFVDGQWYHVAAVADYPLGYIRLYLDGALVAEQQKSFTPVNRTVLIHAGHWSDGGPGIAHFAGRIDELRVYGAPLSAATIAEHYGAAAGTYGNAGEAAIASGWHFDEGTGTQVNSYVGGATGTCKNGAAWGPGIVPLP